MIRKTLLTFVLLSLPFSVFALIPGMGGVESPVQREDIIQRTEQIRTETMERVRQIQSIKDEEDVEERKNRIEEHKSEILERSAGVKEEFSGRIEALKGKENNNLSVPEAVRERMSQLVQERSENLAQRINSINLRFSEAYFQMLDRTEQLIDRLEERTSRLEDLLEIDLTEVHSKLTEAREQVSAAKEIISVQLEEVYEVSAESMQDLGNSFRETMARMQERHKELRNSFIVPIRETIREAHMILRDIVSSGMGDREEKEQEAEEQE